MSAFLTWPDLTLPPINLWSVPRMQSKDYKDQFDIMERMKSGPELLEAMHKAATGVKHDEEKIPLDLLDPLALEGLAKVLQFGAKKYARENWRGGISYSRVFAALLRHTFAILRGEYIDPESGLPHIDHVGCCWMFASYFMKKRPDLDDLYKEPK